MYHVHVSRIIDKLYNDCTFRLLATAYDAKAYTAHRHRSLLVNSYGHLTPASHCYKHKDLTVKRLLL